MKVTIYQYFVKMIEIHDALEVKENYFPKQLFYKTNDELNIKRTPSAVKEWMKENRMSRAVYRIPDLNEFDSTPIQQEKVKSVFVTSTNENNDIDLDDESEDDLILVDEKFENIIEQLHKSLDTDHGLKINFKNGSIVEVSDELATKVLGILLDESIKPADRLKLQQFASESYENLLKF